MESEALEKLKKAGAAVAEAKRYAQAHVRAGVRALEVADAIEDLIRKQGAEPAFPVNISWNHIAAHDLPDHEDVRTFKDGDVVKVDVGAHVDGWMADSAITVIVGKNETGEIIV